MYRRRESFSFDRCGSVRPASGLSLELEVHVACRNLKIIQGGGGGGGGEIVQISLGK